MLSSLAELHEALPALEEVRARDRGVWIVCQVARPPRDSRHGAQRVAVLAKQPTERDLVAALDGVRRLAADLLDGASVLDALDELRPALESVLSCENELHVRERQRGSGVRMEFVDAR